MEGYNNFLVSVCICNKVLYIILTSAFHELLTIVEKAEYKNPCKKNHSLDAKIMIQMNDSFYNWDVTKEGPSGEKCEGVPTLYNISIHLQKGSLTGIAGLVGSGKSSILSAILGEVGKFIMILTISM